MLYWHICVDSVRLRHYNVADKMICLIMTREGTNEMKKKIAFLLAVVMVLGLLPIGVFVSKPDAVSRFIKNRCG